MKITILIGAIRGLRTKIVAEHLLGMLKERCPEAEAGVIDLADHEMEFSDGRHYLDYSGDTGKVVGELMESDTILLITPIYQASIPGSLKNVFDLLPEQAFRDKVVGIVAVAGSDKHYLAIEQQLKPILAFMKALIVQNYVFMLTTDFVDGHIANDDLIFRLDRLVDETIHLTRVHQQIQLEEEQKYDF